MTLKPVLVDTGPDCFNHPHLPADAPSLRRCPQVDAAAPLHVLPVITEAAYLLRNKREEVQHLLFNFQIGLFEMVPLLENDLPAVQDILAKYDDQKFDLAGACLMHLADRQDIETIFTLDRRDFNIYRNKAGKALSLVPLNK